MSSKPNPGMNPQVQAALDKLEEAQNGIEIAGEQLSTVDGYADPWNSIMLLHGTIRQEQQGLANHKPRELE